MRHASILLIVCCLLFTSAESALIYQNQVKDSVAGVEGLWGAQCAVVSPDGKYLYAAGSWDDAISWFSINSGTGKCSYIGCYSGNPHPVLRPRAIAFSPEGNYVYVTSTTDSSINWFARNASTGELGYSGSLKEGRNGVTGLFQAHSIAVSADGRHCYITGNLDKTISWYTIDAGDGSLAFGGFLRDSVDVEGLNGAYSVCVSNDDKYVYVASYLWVDWFSRNATTGALSFKGCIKNSDQTPALETVNGIVISPDDKNIYCVAASSDALVWFTRDVSNGQLTYGGYIQNLVASTGSSVDDTLGLNGAYSVAVNPDGSEIYVASRWSDAVTWFYRNATTGEPVFGGTIKNRVALRDAKWVCTDPQGKYVYVASTGDNSVSMFKVADANVRAQIAERKGIAGNPVSDLIILDKKISVPFVRGYIAGGRIFCTLDGRSISQKLIGRSSPALIR